MLDTSNSNASLKYPPNLKEWLYYDQSLTDKLKKLSGEAQLELLFQGWKESIFCDKKKFDLGSVDNSLSESLRPATCSRDPEVLVNTSTAAVELECNGSREQVAGSRGLNYQLTLNEKFFQREIFMKSHDVIYWYARTIIPYSCYSIQPDFFSRLEKKSVKNLIFNKKEVNLINRIIYPINEKDIEFEWLKNHLPTPEKEYWLRLAEFSFLNKSSFYLIEILFSNLGQIK